MIVEDVTSVTERKKHKSDRGYCGFWLGDAAQAAVLLALRLGDT